MTPDMFAEWSPGGIYDIDSRWAHQRYLMQQIWFGPGRRTRGGAKAPYALKSSWRFWR